MYHKLKKIPLILRLLGLIFIILLILSVYFFRGSLIAIAKNVTNQPCSRNDLNYKPLYYLPLGLPIIINQPQYYRAKNCAPIGIYLKTNTTEEQLTTLLNNLKNNKDILDVKYTSPEQAVLNYKKSIQNEPSFLELMPKGNFLPASIQIFVNYKENRNQIISDLKTNPIVETIIDSSH